MRSSISSYHRKLKKSITNIGRKVKFQRGRVKMTLKEYFGQHGIAALEDCRIAMIYADRLHALIEGDATLQKLYMELSQKAFLQVEEKSGSFQRMDAKERYLIFLKQYPDISQRAKQEHIASYLGITPSSLSRIKRGL